MSGAARKAVAKAVQQGPAPSIAKLRVRKAKRRILSAMLLKELFNPGYALCGAATLPPLATSTDALARFPLSSNCRANLTGVLRIRVETMNATGPVNAALRRLLTHCMPSSSRRLCQLPPLLQAQVSDQRRRGVVPCAAHDRAARMRARAARVQALRLHKAGRCVLGSMPFPLVGPTRSASACARPAHQPAAAHLHGRAVREAVGEAEAVVDVVDVAAGDAKVALDGRGGQREAVHNQRAGACKAAGGRAAAQLCAPLLLGKDRGADNQNAAPLAAGEAPLWTEQTPGLPGTASQAVGCGSVCGEAGAQETHPAQNGPAGPAGAAHTAPPPPPSWSPPARRAPTAQTAPRCSAPPRLWRRGRGAASVSHSHRTGLQSTGSVGACADWPAAHRWEATHP